MTGPLSRHSRLPTAPGPPFSLHGIKMAALGEDLLATVNKLQDLVFNTIGNDSLDLPQIVGFPNGAPTSTYVSTFDRLTRTGRRRFAIVR